jgi:hypothetical protein
MQTSSAWVSLSLSACIVPGDGVLKDKRTPLVMNTVLRCGAEINQLI